VSGGGVYHQNQTRRPWDGAYFDHSGWEGEIIRVHTRATIAEGIHRSDSTTEQPVPTSSSPHGRRGLDGSLAPGGAPYPKGPLDLGHQWNVGFVSSTLCEKTTVSASSRVARRVAKRKLTM